MIDPIISLAFSMQSNRGVYALLLGSGISRSAKIPTGWEITLDLIRQLAVASSENCTPSPEQWFKAKFNQEPDYSLLLDLLAKAPAERQQMLRGYLEASEDEREQGLKQPTSAHRAIANLVAKGFIKVIITTNFDRLIEVALADAGVIPTVLSSPDHVEGAIPLIHTRSCIIKVHGDYLDTRIRNTSAELSEYSPEFNNILDRVFDEFGLIVCGWSAEWDEALCKAITRAPARRFTTYWAQHGEAKGSAMQLIAHRSAQVISIKNADNFFELLHQKVVSLDEFSRPHPLSTEAAVATIKRYMSEHKFRIQYADLISDEVDRIREAASSESVRKMEGLQPDSEAINTRVLSYDAMSETLVAMALQAGFWAEEGHHQPWERAIRTLVSSLHQGPSHARHPRWIELQTYPARLIFFALCLSATESEKFSFLSQIFNIKIQRDSRQNMPAVALLPPRCLFEDGRTGQMLEGMKNRHAPVSDFFFRKFLEYSKKMFPSEARYEHIFDKLEILMALSYGYHDKKSSGMTWYPIGAFGYRHQNRIQILDEINKSLKNEDSQYVKNKLFGESKEECESTLGNFLAFMEQVRWH